MLSSLGERSMVIARKTDIYVPEKKGERVMNSRDGYQSYQGSTREYQQHLLCCKSNLLHKERLEGAEALSAPHL